MLDMVWLDDVHMGIDIDRHTIVLTDLQLVLLDVRTDELKALKSFLNRFGEVGEVTNVYTTLDPPTGLSTITLVMAEKPELTTGDKAKPFVLAWFASREATITAYL